MDRLDQYSFDQFKDFFEYHFQKNTKSGSRKMTLQEFAVRLGYNSPSSLSMVAKGSRLPSTTLLESLFDYWKINSTDKDRVRLLVEVEKRKRKGQNVFPTLEKLNKISNYKKIDLKYYSVVKDWYVLVIKLMVANKNFLEDPLWISQRLRKKITPSQAKKALELLLDLNLIRRDPVTSKLFSTDDNTETQHDFSSEAIRENHKSMMTRAIEAVDEQNLKQRHLNSLSLQFDIEKMPEAKQKILEFIKQFNSEFQATKPSSIYQLNVQFFEHTDEGSKNDI